MEKGVHFCQVKGVSYRNTNGSSRSEAMKLCSIGDTVKLVPEPWNEHDRNAIRVELLAGQQIGYISARQAARFAGRLKFLAATVHSRVKDDWGNDTLKLRVVDSLEQQPEGVRPSPQVTASEQGVSGKQDTSWNSCLAVLIATFLLVLLGMVCVKSCS